MKKYLGVDIGGTFIKLGIVDDAGDVRMRREIPIDRSGNATVMETLMRGIDALIEERLQAKKSKNYARADEIREELSSSG